MVTTVNVLSVRNIAFLLLISGSHEETHQIDNVAHYIDMLNIGTSTLVLG